MTEKKNTPTIFTDTINIYDGLDLSLDEEFDSYVYTNKIIHEWNETVNVPLESKHPTAEIDSSIVEQGEVTERLDIEDDTDSFFRNLADQNDELSEISIIDKIGEGGMGTVFWANKGFRSEKSP